MCKITEKVGNIKMLMDRNDIMRSFSQFIKDGDPFGINFIGKSICDDRFFIEREVSEIMSLEYIIDGKGTLEINGQTLNPEKGDVFFLTEGSSHRYYTDKSFPWRKYFVSFTGPLAIKLKELYLPYNTFLFKNSDVKKNFETIFKIAFDDSKSYEEINQCVTIEIMKIILYLHSRNAGENEDLADKIKKKIDYCVEGEFSLDEIADKLSYSKNHIINIFREKYGKTPYRYYIDAKIEIAKKYLSHTACSVSDISANLSFSDPQYFSSYFKRVTGFSPREYRKISKR